MLAIIINLTICGLWHGANWTYALFGFLHGCYFIPLVLKGAVNKNKEISKSKLLPSFTEFRNMLGIFILLMLSIVLFRSDNVSHAFNYWRKLISPSLFSIPKTPDKVKTFISLLFGFLMILIEWFSREYQYGLGHLKHTWPKPIRWAAYYIIILVILYFQGGELQFIYAQF
jgi:D-alanyl-lipoteichoic acid acyltransferase DltB (MBOAT superfamily)